MSQRFNKVAASSLPGLWGANTIQTATGINMWPHRCTHVQSKFLHSNKWSHLNENCWTERITTKEKTDMNII